MQLILCQRKPSPYPLGKTQEPIHIMKRKLVLSEINGRVSDKMKFLKEPQSLENRVIRRIRAAKSGSVFSAMHFLDFCTRSGVDQALSRLCRAGTLSRCGRGLYALPKSHPWFGEMKPEAPALAKAIAAQKGLELRPAEAEAANLLGLSEQVPARAAYLTGGRSQKLRVGNATIDLRGRSSRLMKMSPTPTGLVVSALRSLGKGHVPQEKLERLRRDLPEKDRRTLLRELPLAPAWMHPHLRYLAMGEDNP